MLEATQRQVAYAARLKAMGDSIPDLEEEARFPPRHSHSNY